MFTILIVDDEKKIRNVYKALFEHEGYYVITVANIIEARTFLMAVPIDLMLLDINMCDYNGDILYEVVKNFHKNVRIIISSVYPVEDQKLLMSEAVDYFDKAEGTKLLLEKVRNLLNQNPVISHSI